jgi:hypothetical protein
MKRSMVVVLSCMISGMLVACLSMQFGSFVNNDLAFSKKEWQSKKICIFPSFLPAKANVSQIVLEERAFASLQSFNIGEVVPAKTVKKMIIDKKLIESYESLVKQYQMFNELDDASVMEIVEKLGFDYAVGLNAVSDNPFNNSDGYGFYAMTQLTLYDVRGKRVPKVFRSRGESSHPKEKHKKKAGVGDILEEIFSDDPPLYSLAYNRSASESLFDFQMMFKGECTSGDCINGHGVYTWYNFKGIFSRDSFEGEWQNGLAHGKGAIYRWKDDLKVLSKYDGVWENGKLKKIGLEYYSVDGQWVLPDQNTEMRLLRKNQ